MIQYNIYITITKIMGIFVILAGFATGIYLKDTAVIMALVGTGSTMLIAKTLTEHKTRVPKEEFKG